MRIETASLDDPEVAALVAIHLRGMHAFSPPGHVFALDDQGLRREDVTLYGAWGDGVLAGMGALKTVSPERGEIKSMRTHPDHVRRGVGAALLEHIIGAARRRGHGVLSLETGSGEAFEAATQLYLKRGFEPGEAFGDYVGSAFNRFLHLKL